MRTGYTDLPLHGGKCPPWLFERMKKLAPLIIEVVVQEFGSQEVLRRLADPFWFQAFGCVLGFDWHSSGLTTTVCGALKEGLKDDCLDLYIAGGKGRASRATPKEIISLADEHSLTVDASALQYASRLAAKVDSAALQDGYQIYHHLFVFTRDGDWAVVQQGMNPRNRLARRYHWLSTDMTDFVSEPHKAICCDDRSDHILNMVARESQRARTAITTLTREKPQTVLAELSLMQKSRKKQPAIGTQLSLFEPNPEETKLKNLATLNTTGFVLGANHAIPHTKHLLKVLDQAYEQAPKDFEQLLALPGVGPSTIRALAMVAEVAYGASASFKDPVRYAFAHGGKDGYPFPVNRDDYDYSINMLQEAVAASKIDRSDKLKALRQLAQWQGDQQIQ